ncbi:MAG: rod shape-determining protein MreD [Calditrichales bacterium]|nr:MAG: rod shape-determining protein MreD [Calditrichales bacterium]
MPRESKSNPLYLVIAGVTAIIVQAFFVPLIEIGVWRPDVIVLLVIYISYRYGVLPGVFSGFMLGVFQDALSPLPLGVSSLANSIIAFMAGQISQFKLAPNARILASVLLILFHGCIFYFFYQLRTDVTYVYLLLTRVFPNTVYTFLIGLLFSSFMKSPMES